MTRESHERFLLGVPDDVADWDGGDGEAQWFTGTGGGLWACAVDRPNAAQIRASYVRQQKTDSAMWAHPQAGEEGRFPKLWMRSGTAGSATVGDAPEKLVQGYAAGEERNCNTVR